MIEFGVSRLIPNLFLISILIGLYRRSHSSSERMVSLDLYSSLGIRTMLFKYRNCLSVKDLNLSLSLKEAISDEIWCLIKFLLYCANIQTPKYLVESLGDMF